MLPNTSTRVREHTGSHLNERIEQDMQRRVAAFQSEDRNKLLSQRLNELDHEWDTERTLQTNFAILSLVGLALATKVSKRWFALGTGVPAFMVQHALQGWCPPLAVLRRLGFRTAREINEERFALKAIRGDFNEAAQTKNVDDIIRAVKS